MDATLASRNVVVKSRADVATTAVVQTIAATPIAGMQTIAATPAVVAARRSTAAS